jgi:hypothetical protein
MECRQGGVKGYVTLRESRDAVKRSDGVAECVGRRPGRDDVHPHRERVPQKGRRRGANHRHVSVDAELAQHRRAERGRRRREIHHPAGLASRQRSPHVVPERRRPRRAVHLERLQRHPASSEQPRERLPVLVPRQIEHPPPTTLPQDEPRESLRRPRRRTPANLVRRRGQVHRERGVDLRRSRRRRVPDDVKRDRAPVRWDA